MTFLTRHAPKQISDLVFRDADVGNTIADYANGQRDKHLLLYGPAGSGKSIAAQIILNARLGPLAGTAVGTPINPRAYKFDDFEPLLRDWSAQRMEGVERGYTVIDEVDFFSDRMLERLRAFIDSTELGTIIVTTNNLHKLDEPLKDRFRKLLVERPTASDWTARVRAIFAAEGFVFTDQEASILLSSFEGSARQLIEWIEDYVLEFKRKPLPKNSPAAPSRFITLPVGKALITGQPVSGSE